MAMDVVSIGNGVPLQDAHRPQPHQEAPPPQPATETEKVPIETVLRELQSISAGFNRKLSFSINEKLDQVVVRVIDTDSNEVIREIPPAELQRVHERIREVMGILFSADA
jgi:flagellar protein FlaG